MGVDQGLFNDKPGPTKGIFDKRRRKKWVLKQRVKLEKDP